MNTLDQSLAPLFEAGFLPRGILALAAHTPHLGSHAESYSPDITAEQFTGLWPTIEDSFQEISDQQLPARRIRFHGRKRDLHCFRRADGTVLAALLDNTYADAKGGELQRLAARFEHGTA